MEKIKLSFLEILAADAEINGVYRPAVLDESGNQLEPEIKIKGLLNEESLKSIVVRFRLGRIAELIATEKKAFNDAQQDLASILGEKKEDGRIVIEKEIKGKPNPKFAEFQEENKKLLEEERELKFKPIDISDLANVESNEKYSIIFKFVKE